MREIKEAGGRDFYGCEIIPLVCARKRSTRNRTRRSGCLIVGHACRAAPRVASLFVLIHIYTTVRTGPPNCTLRAGSGGACAVTLACRHICLAHAPSVPPAPFPRLTHARAPRARLPPSCAPVRYARATEIRDSFQAARATCVASPLSRAQVACPSRPAFSSRKLLPLLAALLASPIFIFSLCARLSCAV